MRATQTDTLRFFTQLTQTYGGLVHFRAGPIPVYLVSHPNYIHHMLRDKQSLYSKNTYTYNSMRQIFGLSLITSDGPEWLERRRSLQPVFHPRHVETLDRTVIDTCHQMINRWKSYRETPFDIQKEIAELTLSIAAQAFFNVELGQDAVEMVDAYRVLTRAFMRRYMSKSAAIWSLLNFPFPNDGQIRQARQCLENSAAYVVEQVRMNNDSDSQLLRELINARDPESGSSLSASALNAEVYTLLFTGHETTSHTIVWALYLLARHPNIWSKLVEEVNSVLGDRPPVVNDLSNLPFSRMVIEETLRLYPAVWSFSRRAEEDDQVGPYLIPKGARILISPYLTHRLPEFWDNPELFLPERFDIPHPMRLENGYLPFGAGARQCIGKGFALLEAQLVLVLLSQHIQLQLANNITIPAIPGFTLRPSCPVMMKSA